MAQKNKIAELSPLELIECHYAGHKKARKILLAHSQQVARLAVAVAERISRRRSVDILFVEQAALLHDIGMLFTNTPKLGCKGDQPYITHGVIGAELLRNEGLPRHALVCERHIGVGLTIEDIKVQNLPLPLREMSPQSLEEEIVAYADLFFSKTRKGMRHVEKVRKSLAKYGLHKVAIFDKWQEQFKH